MNVNKRVDTKIAVKRYIVGFSLSLVLTLTAFWLVSQYLGNEHFALSHATLVAIIVGLAVTQLIVQLLFFLHLGHESKPRWNLVVFLFMLLVLGILVFGSLWIMQNLNYNMMSPSETKQYLKDHPGSF